MIGLAAVARRDSCLTGAIAASRFTSVLRTQTLMSKDLFPNRLRYIWANRDTLVPDFSQVTSNAMDRSGPFTRAITTLEFDETIREFLDYCDMSANQFSDTTCFRCLIPWRTINMLLHLDLQY